MKRALLFILCIVFSNPIFAGTITITKDGLPHAAIVVSAQASATENHAAEQLSHYVKEISGAKLPIRTPVETVEGSRIFIGTTKRWREFGLKEDNFKQTELDEEGFVIQTSNGNLILSGRTSLGTLFAVYHFLERNLGCRWLVPGQLGEIIPKAKTLIVHELQDVENPAFNIRAFAMHSSKEGQEWAVRNRLNGFYSREFAKSREGLLYFQPGTAGFHSFFQLLPADKYFEKYPDIFPLLGGKRHPYSVRSGQLCTTNPKTEELMSEVLLDYFKKNPDARLCTLSPNDGYGWCECDRCREFDKKYVHGRKGVMTDRLIDFINRVMRNVNARFPDKKVVTLSYVNYVQPPSTFKPSPNVIVFQCHYTPACYAHAIEDPNCPQNVLFDKHLRKWLEVAPNSLGIYAYTDKSMWFYLPRPVTRPMAADIKHFYKLGVRSYYAQSSAGAWDLNLPLYYVTARLLWNPHLNVDDLMDDFFKNFFKESSEPMHEFYRTFEKAMMQPQVHINADPITEAPQFLSDEVMDNAERYLEQAEKLARLEPVRERLAAVRSRFDRNKKLWGVISHYHHYNKTGDRDELKKAAGSIRELIKQWGKRSYFAGRFRPILEEAENNGVLWRGFGDKEEKGGRICRNSDESGPGDGSAGWASFSFLVEDLTKPLRVTMQVWGTSQLGSIVICSKGHGKGTSSGGIWKSIRPEKPLSGKEQWDEIVYIIPPELFEADTKKQIIGFGGADSQVYIADIKIEQEK